MTIHPVLQRLPTSDRWGERMKCKKREPGKLCVKISSKLVSAVKYTSFRMTMHITCVLHTKCSSGILRCLSTGVNAIWWQNSNAMQLGPVLKRVKLWFHKKVLASCSSVPNTWITRQLQFLTIVGGFFPRLFFPEFFEPTCAHARWALMHHFLSVCEQKSD